MHMSRNFHVQIYFDVWFRTVAPPKDIGTS
jgi:hypothetical protein